MENAIENKVETGIKVLGKNDLPPLLKEIPDPPKQLHIRGKFPEQNVPGDGKGGSRKFLCIVGARKNSRYGKDVCQSLIAGLRGYDIIIVSGLALGIDGIAHEAALSAGLTTVAVPGSGLSWEVLYPAENRKLAKRILAAGGALISEFKNDFRAAPYGFPQRNRIMAGISHAALIIEAELKSGTLITSRLATEYNRDVFTVPGSIFSTKSEGPHMLIRLGATPVRNSNDILEALGFLKYEEADTDRKEKQYKNCTLLERKILEILKVPMSRVELINQSSEHGMSPSETIVAISLLEIKGFIQENMGEVRLKF